MEGQEMLQNLGEGLNYFYLREARAYLVFRNYITTVPTRSKTEPLSVALCVDGLFVSLENSIVKVISTLISANVSIN
jgi:hypothetical protein